METCTVRECIDKFMQFLEQCLLLNFGSRKCHAELSVLSRQSEISLFLQGQIKLSKIVLGSLVLVRLMRAVNVLLFFRKIGRPLFTNYKRQKGLAHWTVQSKPAEFRHGALLQSLTEDLTR